MLFDIVSVVGTYVDVCMNIINKSAIKSKCFALAVETWHWLKTHTHTTKGVAP